MDGDRARNNRDIREGVAKIVNEDTAEIEVAAPAYESKRDAAVHGERADGSPDHPAFDHFHGGAKAFKSFIAQPERKQNENKGVRESGQGAGAMIAVGLFAVGGTLGPAHGEV